MPPQQTAGVKRPADMDAETARRMLANPAAAAAARMAAGQQPGQPERKSARPPLPPPHVLEALVPDSPAFAELVRMEAKLDWTLLRKKAEINDALGRSTRIKRTLRVFLSNTAHDQAWQKENGEGEAKVDGSNEGEKKEDGVDVNTGKGVAGWVMRIEGRMLDVSLVEAKELTADGKQPPRQAEAQALVLPALPGRRV